MSSKVIKGKKYSIVLNEDEVPGNRKSKLHQKFASIESVMSKYSKNGVVLWVNEHICTPREVAHFCIMHEDKGYMPECIADADGFLSEIHFDIL